MAHRDRPEQFVQREVSSSTTSFGSFGAPDRTWSGISSSAGSPDCVSTSFADLEVANATLPGAFVQSSQAHAIDHASTVPVNHYCHSNYPFFVAVEPSHEAPVFYEPSLESSENWMHAIPSGWMDTNPSQGHGDQHPISYTSPATSEHHLPDSATATVPISTDKKAEPSAICLLENCRKPITGTLSTPAVSKHLRDDHAEFMTGKDDRQCGWPGCRRMLKRESIVKHIANSHLHAARRKCPRCLNSYSTKDAFTRHQSSCSAQCSKARPSRYRTQSIFGRTSGL